MIAGGGGVLCNRCNVKGFGFRPTEAELVDHHLIPKILDPDSDRHYIADVNDLTQLEPSELFGITQKNPDDREGYFFLSPTYNKNGKIIREGKNGHWSETGKKVSIDSAAAVDVDAKKSTFVFLQGGTRTAWFIYLFKLARHQGEKDIFLCKLVEHKQKDRDSINKRKAEHNEQETSAKPKRAKKDNSLRKKAKVSSAKEAQLHDDRINNILSSEVPHGSRSLPSEPDSSIITGDQLTPQSHHLPSKVSNENIFNMLAGDHDWPGGWHPSNGFLDDIQEFSDNQRHHLPSSSINNISTYVGMQPNYHLPSSTSDEISDNEDPKYNEQGKEGSQLSFHIPLDPANDIRSSELLQQSHHLPSSSINNISTYVGMQPNYHLPSSTSNEISNNEDPNNYCLSTKELEAPLERPQPSTTADIWGYNELPPSSDLSRGADKFQEQCDNSEEEDDSFLEYLLSILG